jgi:hypothetical protein
MAQTVWPLLLVLASLVLSGCQSTPPGQQNGGSPDEVHRQLIWLKLDDLLPLEHAQRYGALFDHMTVPEPDRPGRRAQFLKLTKCAETVLGPVTQVNRSRSTFKLVKGVYVVTLPVIRLNANVLEQWAFVATPDGTLKWQGLHWLTNRSDFLVCAASVPGLTVKPAKNQNQSKKAKMPADDPPKPAAVVKPNETPTKPALPVARVKHTATHVVKDVNKTKSAVKQPAVKAASPPVINPVEPKPPVSAPPDNATPHDPDAPLSHTNHQ